MSTMATGLANTLTGKSASALQDYFLKIDSIEGESTDSKHAKEIDVIEWQIGVTNGASMGFQGGGGSGKANFQDFGFRMRVSKASPKLFLACATGQHIPKAVLTVRKAGGGQQEFYFITLSDLLISEYQTLGSAEDNSLPYDHIKINYSKIEVEYKAQDKTGAVTGSIKAGYDLKANQKV